MPRRSWNGSERDEALELCVRVLLRKLSPTERAAYILREAFDYSYREIAHVLHLEVANARQVVTRARQHVADGRRAPADSGEHSRLLEALSAAAHDGDVPPRKYPYIGRRMVWYAPRLHRIPCDPPCGFRLRLLRQSAHRKVQRESCVHLVMQEVQRGTRRIREVGDHCVARRGRRVQSGARRHGKHGIHGNPGNVLSVSYRF